MCRIASEASYPIVKFTTNSNHPDSNSDKQEDNFEWQSGDRCIWAYSCHFRGNTIAKVYQPNTGAHCSGKCADTDGCTHFYWNGHTEYCWLKSGSVSKSDAISNDSDNLVVCGIITND